VLSRFNLGQDKEIPKRRLQNVQLELSKDKNYGIEDGIEKTRSESRREIPDQSIKTSGKIQTFKPYQAGRPHGIIRRLLGHVNGSGKPTVSFTGHGGCKRILSGVPRSRYALR
jgi:antitoxin component YwqK of YwqJK toxin-antitoxin module